MVRVRVGDESGAFLTIVMQVERSSVDKIGDSMQDSLQVTSAGAMHHTRELANSVRQIRASYTRDVV